MEKIIAVTGATGAQGGGLARAILADSAREFRVRALTRDVSSTGARALAAAGAEVVAADLDDEDSLRGAFEGVHGVYVVTNYFAERSAEEVAARSAADMELEQAGNAARAARAAEVQHVIWSTLDDTRPHFGDSGRVPLLDDGRYTVPHFDAKSEADELFRTAGVPTTYLRTTFYYESLAGPLAPVREADGTLVLTLPMADKRIAAIAAEDIGRTALGIFRRGPQEYAGRTVSIAGDHLTGEEIAHAMASAIGEPVHYRPLSWDDFRALGFAGAVEFGNMFQFYAENSEQFTGDRELDVVRELNPRLQTLSDWLDAHRAELRF